MININNWCLILKQLDKKNTGTDKRTKKELTKQMYRNANITFLIIEYK